MADDLDFGDMPPLSARAGTSPAPFADAAIPPASEPPADFDLEPELPVPDGGGLDPSSGPGEIFESLLKYARRNHASDIHVVAERPAMLRIGGDIKPLGEPLRPPWSKKCCSPSCPRACAATSTTTARATSRSSHPALGRFRANVTRQRTGYKLTARPIGEHVPDARRARAARVDRSAPRITTRA